MQPETQDTNGTESVSEQERTEFDWIDALEEERKSVLAEAKTRAKLIKAKIDRIAQNVLETTTDEEQHYYASVFYWQYNGIVNANKVAKLVGLKSGSQLKDWVIPAYWDVTCESCGEQFQYELPARSYVNTKRQVPRWCDACWDRIQREEKIGKYSESYKGANPSTVEELLELQTMPYDKYLKTDHWQYKRKGALKRAGYRCQVCNTNERTLHVHHRTYERRGQELASDLIVLCDDCHKTFHDNGKVSS